MGITRRTTVGLTAVVALLAVALGTQVALAGGDSGPAGASDEELLDRLADVEPTLPGMLPSDVEFDEEDGVATIDGDFGGAAATIETISSELRSLFRDADDAESAVADAVAEVARGWLDLGQAYEALAAWEANDLAFPLDSYDDDGVATGADEVRGHAERGLRHALVAQDRLADGYLVLREEGAAADAEAQAAFDRRAGEVEEWQVEVRPLIHELLALASSSVLVPSDRFETDAPGVDARARAVTITCVDREAYAELLASGDLSPEAIAAVEQHDDCPELPDGLGAVTDDEG